MRFNGMNAAVQSAVQFAAPAVAGAVLISGTLRSTLWIDVATAAVGVAVLLCVSLPAPEKKQDALWPALRAGVGYAVRDRTVGRLLAVYGAFVFFCVPGGFLAGLHVSRVFGDSYEYLTATELAGFAGMAAGGILMGLWGGFARKEHTLLAGLAAFGTLSILLGSSVRFDIYLGVMALYGSGADHGADRSVHSAADALGARHAGTCIRADGGRLFGLHAAWYGGLWPVGGPAPA